MDGKNGRTLSLRGSVLGHAVKGGEKTGPNFQSPSKGLWPFRKRKKGASFG